MLISYPLLPADAASTPMDLDRFIGSYVYGDKGIYPVSWGNRWHGGIHLRPGAQAIRAIADAEVVAYRVAAATETYGEMGDYDTSFVLLKHSTESGEHTPVVFYSLSMHLKPVSQLLPAQKAQLPDFLKSATADGSVQPGKGVKVWRKDVLGFGGRLYGHDENVVHFEILMPAIDAFWQDSSALAAGSSGSADVFGDACFVIPPGKDFLAQHPRALATHAAGQRRIGDVVMPDGQYGRNITSRRLPAFDESLEGSGAQISNNDGRLFVCLRDDKGKRTATSYRCNAQGTYVQVGPPVEQPEYEYHLYTLAATLYPDCPSAGYEWLRFGRVLGTDTTATTENWQRVCYNGEAGAVGYIDLAAADITKLSDADFPFWRGWQTVEETSGIYQADGICDVATLQDLLHIPVANDDGHSEGDPPDFVTTVTTPQVAEQLRHLVCKYNSEWDASDLDTRYARLREKGRPLESDDAWKAFVAHVNKLAFGSGIGLPRSVWHVHPLQFIEHYRRCGWLSRNELIQLFPMTAMRESGHAWVSEGVTIPPPTIVAYRVDLNKAARKYGITTPLRMAAFYANAMVETQWFGTLIEVVQKKKRMVNGQPVMVNGKAVMEESPPRYAPWIGRGFLQLTWPDNYVRYWRFAGKTVAQKLADDLHAAAKQADTQHTNAPLAALEAQVPAEMGDWRRNVATVTFDATDSAGAYWAWSGAAEDADTAPVNVRASEAVHGNAMTYYTSQGAGHVAATVNVGHRVTNYSSVNGIVARFQAYATCQVVLLDATAFPDASGKPQSTAEGYAPRRP